MTGKLERYEQLRARFNDSLDTGQTVISDEEHEERIRLNYELNGTQIPGLNVPISVTSSDPKDGGLIIHPKKV